MQCCRDNVTAQWLSTVLSQWRARNDESALGERLARTAVVTVAGTWVLGNNEWGFHSASVLGSISFEINSTDSSKA